jgi:hypothetical protein
MKLTFTMLLTAGLLTVCSITLAADFKVEIGAAYWFADYDNDLKDWDTQTDATWGPKIRLAYKKVFLESMFLMSDYAHAGDIIDHTLDRTEWDIRAGYEFMENPRITPFIVYDRTGEEYESWHHFGSTRYSGPRDDVVIHSAGFGCGLSYHFEAVGIDLFGDIAYLPYSLFKYTLIHPGYKGNYYPRQWEDDNASALTWEVGVTYLIKPLHLSLETVYRQKINEYNHEFYSESRDVRQTIDGIQMGLSYIF